MKSWQRQDGQSNRLPADLLSREADMTGFPFESLWRDIKDNEISRLLNFKRRQPNNRQAGRRAFEISDTCSRDRDITSGCSCL